jgi:hypothetical protein
MRVQFTHCTGARFIEHWPCIVIDANLKKASIEAEAFFCRLFISSRWPAGAGSNSERCTQPAQLRQPNAIANLQPSVLQTMSAQFFADVLTFSPRRSAAESGAAERAAAVECHDDVPVLRLEKFNTPPKVDFGSVTVGDAKVCLLRVENITSEPQHLEIDKPRICSFTLAFPRHALDVIFCISSHSACLHALVPLTAHKSSRTGFFSRRHCV